MALKTQPKSHQFTACPGVSGCWSLMPGTALSLLPREAGVLRIASGRVWATVDGPHAGHGNESGDHFLQAGEVLAVRAGQRLVFEPWGETLRSPVYFDWTPAVVDLAVPATHWQVAVVQPARDLRHAVLAAGRALGQLFLGLSGYVAGCGLGFGRRVSHQ